MWLERNVFIFSLFLFIWFMRLWTLLPRSSHRFIMMFLYSFFCLTFFGIYIGEGTQQQNGKPITLNALSNVENFLTQRINWKVYNKLLNKFTESESEETTHSYMCISDSKERQRMKKKKMKKKKKPTNIFVLDEKSSDTHKRISNGKSKEFNSNVLSQAKGESVSQNMVSYM